MTGWRIDRFNNSAFESAAGSAPRRSETKQEKVRMTATVGLEIRFTRSSLQEFRLSGFLLLQIHGLGVVHSFTSCSDTSLTMPRARSVNPMSTLPVALSAPV